MEKTRFVPLIAILLVLLVTAALAEILARLAAEPVRFPRPPGSRVQNPTDPNPYIFYCRPFLYSHIPGAHYVQARRNYEVAYSINSRGFRGPEVPPPTDGRKRLLVIGDSIIEGQGCPFDRTIPLVLSGLLRREGWEAVNVGVQGGCPAYYALNLDRYLELSPDAVLVVLYENDMRGDRTYELKYSFLPLLDFPEELVAGTRGSGWKGSAAIRVLERAWRLAVSDRGGRLIRRCAAKARVAGLEPGETSVDMLPTLDEQWALSNEYLDLLAERFEEEDVPVFLSTLVIPVRAGDRLRLQQRFELLAAGWATTRGIDFIPLSHAYDAAIPVQGYNELVIEGDGHLTEAGHAVAARALAGWLKQRLTWSGGDGP